MNERQRAALAAPLTQAGGQIDPALGWEVSPTNEPPFLRIFLTCNVERDNIFWHVSVSFQEERGAVPVGEMKEWEIDGLQRVCLAELRGVGEASAEAWVRGERAIHLFRPLTVDETELMARLQAPRLGQLARQLRAEIG